MCLSCVLFQGCQYLQHTCTSPLKTLRLSWQQAGEGRGAAPDWAQPPPSLLEDLWRNAVQWKSVWIPTAWDAGPVQQQRWQKDVWLLVLAGGGIRLIINSNTQDDLLTFYILSEIYQIYEDHFFIIIIHTIFFPLWSKWAEAVILHTVKVKSAIQTERCWHDVIFCVEIISFPLDLSVLHTYWIMLLKIWQLSVRCRP